MVAIIKREFRSYFTNMIGFVQVAAFCFFFGLYYCVYNVEYGYPYFGSSLTVALNYLMVLIPILTMKSMSEEKASKTDQLLLTSPATVTEIVLGKYLGMVLVFAIPMLFSCIFPILQLRFESHNLVIDYASILAFFLYGCVYISIGLFISAQTQSQIIAAAVTFVVFYILYLADGLIGLIPEASYINAIGFGVIALIVSFIIYNVTKNLYAAVMFMIVCIIAISGTYAVNADVFYNSLPKILTIVTMSDGIKYFASGVFDVSAIVMYFSIIVLFVFLTTQTVNKRRWS